MEFLWETVKLGDKERLKIEEIWRYTWQTQRARAAMWMSGKALLKTETWQERETFHVDFLKRKNPLIKWAKDFHKHKFI